MMMWLAAIVSAYAGDWAGEWGLDPSRSDEPSLLIERAYAGPVLSGNGSSRFSPDGGEVDHDAERSKIVYEALDLLGVSGRLTLKRTPEGSISLGWGDGTVLLLSPGRRWTRVVPEGSTDRYRIRVIDLGEQLFIERRAKLSAVGETFIPQSNGDLVAVVQIDGTTLGEGVEFRRVYRRLDASVPDKDEPAPKP